MGLNSVKIHIRFLERKRQVEKGGGKVSDMPSFSFGGRGEIVISLLDDLEESFGADWNPSQGFTG